MMGCLGCTSKPVTCSDSFFPFEDVDGSILSSDPIVHGSLRITMTHFRTAYQTTSVDDKGAKGVYPYVPYSW